MLVIQTQALIFAYSFVCLVLFRDLPILCVLCVFGRVTYAVKALVWSKVRGQLAGIQSRHEWQAPSPLEPASRPVNDFIFTNVQLKLASHCVRNVGSIPAFGLGSEVLQSILKPGLGRVGSGCCNKLKHCLCSRLQQSGDPKASHCFSWCFVVCGFYFCPEIRFLFIVKAAFQLCGFSCLNLLRVSPCLAYTLFYFV